MSGLSQEDKQAILLIVPLVILMLLILMFPLGDVWKWVLK
jgi:hypothetical protein